MGDFPEEILWRIEGLHFVAELHYPIESLSVEDSKLTALTEHGVTVLDLHER